MQIQFDAHLEAEKNRKKYFDKGRKHFLFAVCYLLSVASLFLLSTFNYTLLDNIESSLQD